jgi:hypothetical protein
MRQVPSSKGDLKKIQIPRRSEIRTHWKATMVVLVATVASFSLGAYANQVRVLNTQSLAGSHILVPAPELIINSTTWNINLNTSTITGITLVVTTTGVSGSPVINKLYQVFVQVSCLNSTGLEFTCATGTSTIVLPSNMNGATAMMVIQISPALDPELIEVHDLSFIVTGSPTPTTPQCPPGTPPSFSITANPTFVSLTTANPKAVVVKTLTANCAFSGTVTVAASVQASSNLVITLVPVSVTLTPNSSATITETIAEGPGAFVPGNFTITNTATSGSLSQSVTITVSVT